MRPSIQFALRAMQLFHLRISSVMQEGKGSLKKGAWRQADFGLACVPLFHRVDFVSTHILRIGRLPFG